MRFLKTGRSYAARPLPLFSDRTRLALLAQFPCVLFLTKAAYSKDITGPGVKAAEVAYVRANT